MSSALPLSVEERRTRNRGVVFFVLASLLGAALLQAIFLLPPLAQSDPWARYGAMGTGALLAFPAVLVYMTVPRLLDRYDPEPWWALMLVFVWGAVGACGFSATVNTVFSSVFGEALGATVSAPVCEEFFKGLGLYMMFRVWRREFDGVVDGIIYATFTALGFAAVENVVYYSKAQIQSHDMLAATFFLRGVVSPWAHPLFTSMTGIGFGIARETTRPTVRFIAPLAGYLAAVVLHAIWNGAAVLSGILRVPLVLLLLPLWFLFVVAFFVMVLVLVRRRGRIIRENLVDEVMMGAMTPQELALVTSAFGQLRARFARHGALRMEFVATAARLALSKWHATRAMKGQTRTVSFDFIGPLRDKMASLRAAMGDPAPTRGNAPWR
ncbi:MAG: PrsW family intramembrane metalloprotease [Myxococcales bacterium]|nr:PrsW family intramembrane metalloprotease [Myxococcales bacterium]